ncbi:helix-turn-helix domain-containing protein [Paenibacillus polymyxa]|uniref:PucR family transcriptional regulator n=1 Tax=Paenibacillus TaxID=44249 RepID=UPI0020B7D5F7|nr:helix-turn-helix domain-containing protein [Paenibacillus polymyxa]MCP3810442.1 helix-turn-helix domain-containing protein [Paenibacillus sp. Lou8.1]MDY8048209.1 helix-turn-helix domain-containing protein [Paenibacillus polymyxa]
MTLNTEWIQQQLQNIIQAPFTIVPWYPEMMAEGETADSVIPDRSFVHDNKLYFPFRASAGELAAFVVEARYLTDRERKLVEALLGNMEQVWQNGPQLSDNPVYSEEERMNRFGQWLIQQAANLNREEEVPDELQLRDSLSACMVPILLNGEGTQEGAITYTQLHRLFASYFGGEVLLTPLDEQSWLIMAKKELLLGADDERDKDTESRDADFTESLEEVLTAFSLGLYELIANEWVGVFHLAVSKPSIPLQSLPQELNLLWETIHLGKIFHVTEHIHFSWELHLERLLNRIPKEQRVLFLEQVMKSSVILEDSETMATLDIFFQLDCNVSETAKRLYVHRNTLIYRLDKIKQETGLDVRTFNDAVLVKLYLLLYKVTKRK